MFQVSEGERGSRGCSLETLAALLSAKEAAAMKLSSEVISKLAFEQIEPLAALDASLENFGHAETV